MATGSLGSDKDDLSGTAPTEKDGLSPAPPPPVDEFASLALPPSSANEPKSVPAPAPTEKEKPITAPTPPVDEYASLALPPSSANEPKSNPAPAPTQDETLVPAPPARTPKSDPGTARTEKEKPIAPKPPADVWASLALPEPAAKPKPNAAAPSDKANATSPLPGPAKDSSGANSADRTAPASEATGSFKARGAGSGIANKPINDLKVGCLPDTLGGSGAPVAPAPPPGRFPSVEGYELLSVLGKGGMGVVYKARHIKLKRLVALKMILAGAHADDQDVQRFRTEAEAVARLQHPNIVQIHEISSHDGQPFFSLEFVDGGSLDRQVRGKPQPVLQAASLLETLANAMHFAHEHGIIHRDLKPANILLTKDGQPKITDFGLAKQLDSQHGQTETGSVLGTPAYMPPEQAQGDTRNLGPAADIYSLGAILYEVLTGKPPFHGETAMDTLLQVQMTEPQRPSRLRPRLPRDLETICLKCLEKTPTRRYATAGALAEDLRRFLNHEPILARPVPAWERGVKWVRRRPAIAVSLGLLVVCTAAALATFGVYQAQEQQRHATSRKRIDEQVLRAQEAEKNEAWTGARDLLLSAAEESQHEPELAGQNVEIQERLERVQRRLQAVARFQNFTQLRDEAIFRATLAGGETGGGSYAQGCTAIEKALDSVGFQLPVEPNWVTDPAFTAEEQAEVRRGCYELRLTLADVVARRSPDSPSEGARRAVLVLAGLTSLGFDTRAYHLRLGRFLATLGDQRGADREARLARKCPANTARDHYLVGEEYYKRGDVEAACAEFEEALRVEGDGFWASYFLALCHVKGGKPRLAVEPLNYCLARKQGLAWIYLLRGFVHGQLANYTAAEADFSEVLARAPSSEALYVLYNNRAVMRVGQKNYDEAGADLKQAIKLKPDQYQAYASLAQVEFQQGRPDAAVAAMDRAVTTAQASVDPGAIDPATLGLLYRTRSRFQLARKDVPAALDDLDRAVGLEAKDSPTLPGLQAERGRLLHRLQNYTDAIVAYSAALQAPKANPEIQRWMAEALVAAQRYPEAVAALRVFSRGGGVLAVKDYQLLALAHHKTGDLRATIDDLTKILEVEPDNLEVLSQRAQVYLVVRAYTLAARDFDRALALSPEPDAALYEGRGLAHAKLGQHQRAASDAEEALRRSVPTTRRAYHAARTLAQAAAQVDVERAPLNSSVVRTRKTYEERSLALLREAIQKLPESQRPAFWRNTVRNDPELNPLHRTVGYAELERAYVKATVATEP